MRLTVLKGITVNMMFPVYFLLLSTRHALGCMFSSKYLSCVCLRVLKHIMKMCVYPQYQGTEFLLT